MPSKKVDIQQDLIMTEGLVEPYSGHVAIGAKADGLYQRLPGLPEEKLGQTLQSMIEDISFEFRDITKGIAQTYILDIKASFGYTIEAAVVETDNGTFALSILIGGRPVTSLDNITVDASTVETSSTDKKTVGAGDRITIVTSTAHTGIPTLLRGKIKIKRT